MLFVITVGSERVPFGSFSKGIVPRKWINVIQISADSRLGSFDHHVGSWDRTTVIRTGNRSLHLYFLGHQGCKP